MSTDCDDIIFVEEIGTSSSSAVTAGFGRNKAPPTTSQPKPKRASSQCTGASSVLLQTWLDTARRDAATTKRDDERRKAAGVKSPAKRPRLKKEEQKTQGEIDMITLDDEDVVELKEDNDEFGKGAVKLSDTVAGSVVTAPVAAILSASTQNIINASPASSQESRSSSRRGRSTASSIGEGSQENIESPAGSQEARAEFVRELRRVEDPREEARASLRDGDVIRNRADRAAMHGQDCPCCSEYYDQLGIDDAERKRRIDQVSRHRYVALPMPRTPPHYWDMDFPTEEEQEKRGMIKRRFEQPAERSDDEKEEEKEEEEEESETGLVEGPEYNSEEAKKEIKDQSSNKDSHIGL